jgi:flagellar basal body-associated protein FliL
MKTKNIILIAIIILVIALIAVGAYIFINNGNANINNIIPNATSDDNATNTSDVIMIDEKGNVENATDNATAVVGDNTPRNETNTTNETYQVYNPQTDSYETVIGEGYDAGVDRWYTYDTDGVRYYNTRIK